MSKTLLITGANRGIGFEMTKQAAGRGDHVIACARNVIEAPDLVTLARDNPAISLLGLDVTAEADMKQIAAGMTRKIDEMTAILPVISDWWRSPSAGSSKCGKNDLAVKKTPAILVIRTDSMARL